MEERYPYIRFVIDAGQVIAGAVALIFFLGGTVSSCQQGGFGGFIGFLISIAIACIVYVAVMVWIETLHVFLDIENSTRQLQAAQRPPAESPPSTPAA